MGPLQAQYGGECQTNKNCMVPLPGTMQAGKLVRFVLGSDFSA